LLVLGFIGLVVVIASSGSHGDGGAGAAGALLLILCMTPFMLALYFLPSFIAFYRKHHQRYAILMLNMFAAWTVLAWAACLVWAFTAMDSREHVHYHYER
jgi:drug/metabolite transporter (DMT)-like permease